jgi:hypothetical protein
MISTSPPICTSSTSPNSSSVLCEKMREDQSFKEGLNL